jgi:hypothetical protein
VIAEVTSSEELIAEDVGIAKTNPVSARVEPASPKREQIPCTPLLGLQGGLVYGVRVDAAAADGS